MSINTRRSRPHCETEGEVNLDPATADPRELAEALRRECKTWLNPRLDVQGEVKLFARTLLAVLDECKLYSPMGSLTDSESIRQVERAGIIRAAARAWLAAGGELSEEG